MIKPGVAILFILAVTVPADTPIQPRSLQRPPERVDCTEWVDRSLGEMGIHIGRQHQAGSAGGVYD